MTTDRPRSSLGVWLVIAAILLPVNYGLSIGPAAWLMHNGYLDSQFHWLYWPIQRLAEHSDLVLNFFRWYLTLWGV